MKIPDGFVLVPAEPTDYMLNAGCRALRDRHLGHSAAWITCPGHTLGDAEQCWRAMIEEAQKLEIRR